MQQLEQKQMNETKVLADTLGALTSQLAYDIYNSHTIGQNRSHDAFPRLKLRDFPENTAILYGFFSLREVPIKEIAAITIDYTKSATVEV